MKNLQTLLIILTAVLFFTACEKEESPETFDSISGILTAGEDMTTEDLNGMEIYLGKFHDSIDFDNITFKTTAIDSVAATTLNADGSFLFNNLAPGNYGLAMKNGFIFSVDTALSINLNGNSECIIQKEIDRLPKENTGKVQIVFANSMGTYDCQVSNFKKGDLPSKYQIKYLYCFFDTIAHQAIDFPEFETYKSKWAFFSWEIIEEDGTHTYFIYSTPPVTFELEVWTYDNNGTVIDKHRSARVPSYDFNDEETPTCKWPGDPVDITWVAYKESGCLWWKDEIPGHYLIEMHK